jgi:hypothetical protein
LANPAGGTPKLEKGGRTNMIKGPTPLAAVAMVVVLGASALIAQGTAGASVPKIKVTPRFAVVRTASHSINVQPPTGLTTWNYHYNYLGTPYSDTFIGTNPTGGASTTTPVDVVPVKLTTGSFVDDPTAGGANSAVSKTLASPLFNSSIKFKPGGTNVGKTQYEDAFQRAALWKKVSKHAGYHVKFATPTVDPTLSLTVPAADGGEYELSDGTLIIAADINWLDPIIDSEVHSLGIPASTLTIFSTVDTYLYDSSISNCCIGGYHTYDGSNTYAEYTYFATPGDFAQDVSALSHELGEWMDDPYVNNTDVPESCGMHGNDQLIYEVGDPLENEANYGDYAYTVSGATWHLQDLVFPRYFGAPAGTSVNHWSTFQGTTLSVCQNGG